MPPGFASPFHTLGIGMRRLPFSARECSTRLGPRSFAKEITANGNPIIPTSSAVLRRERFRLSTTPPARELDSGSFIAFYLGLGRGVRSSGARIYLQQADQPRPENGGAGSARFARGNPGVADFHRRPAFHDARKNKPITFVLAKDLEPMAWL